MAEQERNWDYQAHPRDNHDTRHDHDVDTLILQSHRLYTAAKQMKIQQRKISKRQKKNNERLDKSKGKNSAELQDLKEALEQVNSIVAGTRQNGQFDMSLLSRRRGQKNSLMRASLPRLDMDITRQSMLDLFQNRCEQCREKERLITKQLLEMDRTQVQVQKLYDQVESLSREINKEKVLKEDALRRLGENNSNIANLNDTIRPTKLAEKLSDLYDNAWTDALETMQTSTENEAIQELLKMLMEVYRKCLGLATDGFFERIQRSILYPQDMSSQGECEKDRLPDQMKQQIKVFRKYEAPNVKEAVAKVVLANLPIRGRNEPEIENYLKDCVEICWLAVVQDPPLFLSASHTVEFDKNVYKEYTQSGRYVEFVVWPALYLHEGGPLLSKGVAQRSNTHPRGAVTQTCHATRLVPNVSARIVYRSVSPNARSDLPDRGQIASNQIRDNNPNIADLSDTNRPTKLAEKLTELYDNAWTDAYEALQRPNENEAIQELLTMLMEVYRKCLGLATDGFFERIQRSILYPQDGGCGKERLPDKIKQQIKEFRKYEAPNVKEAVAKVVLANLPIRGRNEPEIEKYLKCCVEICWLAVVQDPPVFLSSSHTVEFDKNAYKEYTQSGRYVEFIVWPALYLHKNGPLLSKGVAQGSNTHPRGAGMQTSHAARHLPNVSAHIVQRSVSPNTRSDLASRGQTDRRDEANWGNEQERRYKQDRRNEIDWMHGTDGRHTFTDPQKGGDSYNRNRQVQHNYQIGENIRGRGIQTTYEPPRGPKNDTGLSQTIHTGQHAHYKNTDV